MQTEGFGIYTNEHTGCAEEIDFNFDSEIVRINERKAVNLATFSAQPSFASATKGLL